MSNYLKYLSAGFEILGMSALGFFLGWQADQYAKLEKPWLTTALSLLFSLGSMIIVLRRFLQENRNQHSSSGRKQGKEDERL